MADKLDEADGLTSAQVTQDKGYELRDFSKRQNESLITI